MPSLFHWVWGCFFDHCPAISAIDSGPIPSPAHGGPDFFSRADLEQREWLGVFCISGRPRRFSRLFPDRLLANVAGQAIWVLLWIWLALFWVFVKNLRLGPARCDADSLQPRRWLFCCLAASPIFLFTLASLWQGGQALLFHWQAPGYLMLFPLLGEAVANGLNQKNRLVRGWLIAAVILFLLLASVVVIHTATGWLQRVAPQWFAYGDPSLDALDWHELPAALAARGMLEQPDLFIASPN